MLEINITCMLKEDTSKYSNSVANSGLENIGQITWNNALESKQSFVNEANKQEFINFFYDFGAWEDIEDWPINELNALFIQFISSDLQEIDMFNSWQDYIEAQEIGKVSGNIFRTENMEYYYTIDGIGR